MALANSQDNFQDTQLPFFLSEMALDFTKTVCLNKVESPTFACTISVNFFRQMEEHFLLLLNTILNQELGVC